jgi:hypothetical protein
MAFSVTSSLTGGDAGAGALGLGGATVALEGLSASVGVAAR